MNRTVCGTPNYIAPEVLTKIGHSYEADIWSIGCNVYSTCGQAAFRNVQPEGDIFQDQTSAV